MLNCAELRVTQVTHWLAESVLVTTLLNFNVGGLYSFERQALPSEHWLSVCRRMSAYSTSYSVCTYFASFSFAQSSTQILTSQLAHLYQSPWHSSSRFGLDHSRSTQPQILQATAMITNLGLEKWKYSKISPWSPVPSSQWICCWSHVWCSRPAVGTFKAESFAVLLLSGRLRAVCVSSPSTGHRRTYLLSWWFEASFGPASPT